MADISDAWNISRQMDGMIQPMYQYNGRMSNVNIDNALASILTRFDSEYIMDMIRYSLEHKFRPYDQAMPNIVYGYEQEFKEILSGFSSNQDDIAERRIDTYKQIINTLCEVHNLQFNDNDSTDYYSAAFYLYKFLVSEFTNNIIAFFTNFLIKERVGIYNSMNLKELAKNDMALTYSNKLFKSEKLSIIHANIGYVIANMESFDVDLYTILNMVYNQSDGTISRYIYSIITDNGNFFKDFFMKYATDAVTGSELQTLVKLNLQTIGSEFVDIDNSKGE